MKLSNRTLWLFMGAMFFFSGPIVAPHVVHGGQQPQKAPSSAIASSQGKPGDAPADGSASTEAETCQACHGDITTSFEQPPHWQTMTDTRRRQSKQACDTCHGSG